MTAFELLTLLHTAGIVLTPFPDGSIRYKAPSGALSPELRQEMAIHKVALLDLVEEFEERVAIVEYCAGLPRAEAEAFSWKWLRLKHKIGEGL